MGDSYWQKIRSLAEKKNVQLVNKICDNCSQLIFDHKPGVCTRSASAEKVGEYTAEQIAEIVNGLSEAVLRIEIPITRLFTVTEDDIAIFSCIIIDRTYNLPTLLFYIVLIPCMCYLSISTAIQGMFRN